MAGSYTILDWDDKDPSEIIHYGVDWASALDSGDSLQTVAYAFLDQAGLSKGAATISGTIAKVTLSAGTAGLTGKLLCTVTTVGGETLEQVVRVKVKTKG